MPHVKNPEQDPPSDLDLITLISRKPRGLSLREICGSVWPDLRWYSLNPGGDSAAQRVRANGKTAALALLERLQVLVSQGYLQEGPPRKDEVDAMAAHLFILSAAGERLYVTERRCAGCNECTSIPLDCGELTAGCDGSGVISRGRT